MSRNPVPPAPPPTHRYPTCLPSRTLPPPLHSSAARARVPPTTTPRFLLATHTSPSLITAQAAGTLIQATTSRATSSRWVPVATITLSTTPRPLPVHQSPKKAQLAIITGRVTPITLPRNGERPSTTIRITSLLSHDAYVPSPTPSCQKTKRDHQPGLRRNPPRSKAVRQETPSDSLDAFSAVAEHHPMDDDRRLVSSDLSDCEEVWIGELSDYIIQTHKRQRQVESWFEASVLVSVVQCFLTRILYNLFRSVIPTPQSRCRDITCPGLHAYLFLRHLPRCFLPLLTRIFCLPFILLRQIQHFSTIRAIPTTMIVHTTLARRRRPESWKKHFLALDRGRDERIHPNVLPMVGCRMRVVILICRLSAAEKTGLSTRRGDSNMTHWRSQRSLRERSTICRCLLPRRQSRKAKERYLIFGNRVSRVPRHRRLLQKVAKNLQQGRSTMDCMGTASDSLVWVRLPVRWQVMPHPLLLAQLRQL